MCTPQWMNDQASCLKCFAVLRRRDIGAGAGSGRAVQDFNRRQPGEASTYKHTAASAMESESGACARSPTGVHKWKFGKCGFCATPEPAKSTNPANQHSSPPLLAYAPPRRPSGLDKSCDKCHKPYQGHGTTCGSCRSHLSRRGSTVQCSICGSFFWGYGDHCEDCASLGVSAPSLRIPDEPAPKRDERTKVECPFCLYKCVPQWLNDRAHCLKCQAVLKVQDTVHGADVGGPSPMCGPLQPGEASTFKHAAGSAMEARGGKCAQSPDGVHLFRFGKCEWCDKAEGKMMKGAGAAVNPGQKGGAGCASGGKCMFKFAKCSKCGRREF